MGERPRGRTPAAAIAHRRRTVLLVLAVAAATTGGASTAWHALAWAAAGCVALLALYVGAVARVRHRAVQREMAIAFGAPGGAFDWDSLGAASPGSAATGDGAVDPPASPAAPEPATTALGLLRFLAAYILGWALTPVAIAIRLLAGDRRDLEGAGTLARIVDLQRRGRAHSLQALAASLAATAGVTAVGSLTGTLDAPIASAAPTAGTYVVRAGDTLGGIASAHGTTVSALSSLNHLADPNLIYPGQTLVLGPGAAATPAAAPASASTYVVRGGDTLGAIAAAHGTTVAALVAANGLADANLIYPGQVLRLAGTAAAPAAATPPARTAGTTSYTVRAGDTLAGIASRFGTSVAALAAANHLADPNRIYVGQVLSIAGTAPLARPAAPASTPATPVSAPAGDLGARALAVALQQLGKPYQWGGAGPASFDCSGLVMYAYDAVGVHLPHYTVWQYDDTAHISAAQLQLGDLVFYGGAAPSHVAMYDGNGMIVTADTTGTPVRVEPMSWDGTPSGFGRVG